MERIRSSTPGGRRHWIQFWPEDGGVWIDIPTDLLIYSGSYEFFPAKPEFFDLSIPPKRTESRVFLATKTAFKKNAPAKLEGLLANASGVAVWVEATLEAPAPENALPSTPHQIQENKTLKKEFVIALFILGIATLFLFLKRRKKNK